MRNNIGFLNNELETITKPFGLIPNKITRAYDRP